MSLYWQVVIQGSDDIASRAIDLLKEIYTNLGPKLQANQVMVQFRCVSNANAKMLAPFSFLTHFCFAGRDP